MATKKAINAWLKENKYTWEQMDAFWEENCAINKKCALLMKCGKSWSDLELCVIATLPTLKETTLEKIAERERIAREEALVAEQKAAQVRYYDEHFVDLMIQKIEKREDLTEQEIARFVRECKVVSREVGAKHRWTQDIFVVLSVGKRYFAVLYDEGLTEYQEDSYYNQPYEVRKHRYKKTIVVEEWIEV